MSTDDETPPASNATEHPRLEERAAQPYVALRMHIEPGGFPAAVDRSFPALFGWLGERGIEPAGAPLIRYLMIAGGPSPDEMAVQVDIGVPVARAVEAEGEVRAESLPAGTWACLLHRGSYAGLHDANERLDRWAADRGVELAGKRGPGGEARPAAHVERYLTDPSSEPDSSKWETEIAILAARAAVEARG